MTRPLRAPVPALALILAALALPAAAQMNAAEFEAYATGKVLHFSDGGAPYGAEEYLPGRRVRWSFLDGICKDGRWYEESGDRICFVYEDRPDPQCWRFRRSAGGLTARYIAETPSATRYEARPSAAPLLCYGPDTGV
ncbi:hypothetical protein [Roseivivax sp. CAU 1761]